MELTLTQYGDSFEGVIVHQDQDPAFTGCAWTRRLLGACVLFSYPGADPAAR